MAYDKHKHISIPRYNKYRFFIFFLTVEYYQIHLNVNMLISFVYPMKLSFRIYICLYDHVFSYIYVCMMDPYVFVCKIGFLQRLFTWERLKFNAKGNVKICLIAMCFAEDQVSRQANAIHLFISIAVAALDWLSDSYGICVVLSCPE